MTPLDPGPAMSCRDRCERRVPPDLSATNGTLPLLPPTILGYEGGHRRLGGVRGQPGEEGRRAIGTFIPSCGVLVLHS
jgi:hypothetical protein